MRKMKQNMKKLMNLTQTSLSETSTHSHGTNLDMYSWVGLTHLKMQNLETLLIHLQMTKTLTQENI